MNLPPLQRVINIDSVWENTAPNVKSFLQDRKKKEDGDKTFIQPTDISEFFNVEQCEKFFMKMVGMKGTDVDVEMRHFNEAYTEISPEFHYSGEKFEDIITDSVSQHNSELIRCGESHIDQLAKIDEMDETYFPDTVNPRIRDAIYGKTKLSVNTRSTYWLFRRLFLQRVVEQYHADVDAEPIIVEQLPLAGNIGVWPVGGKPDILTICSTENGVTVHVSDLKSTHEEKPHYRIQVACYTILIRQLLEQAGILDDVSLAGGVITYEDDYTSFNLDSLPQFDIEVVESDVERVLNEDGKFTRLSEETLQGADYSLTSKCQKCPYKEDCYTNAIENTGLEMLGMGEGIQSFLVSNGITTLRELASLFEESNHDPETKPTNYNPLKTDISNTQERDAMLAILDNETIAMTVMRYAQEAQHLLSHLYPEHESASDTKPAWIKGSGKIPLPDDTPGDKYNVSYTRGELVRVYLTVQYDHRYDRVPAIGVVVDAENVDGEESFVETISVPNDMYNTTTAAGAISAHNYETSVYDNRETELMNRVSETLIETINSVSNEMGVVDPYIHFYTYTEQEIEWLVDAVARVDSPSDSVMALRDLIALTEYGQHEKDQPIHTALSPIIQNNMSLSVPGEHITTVANELYTPDLQEKQTYNVDGDEYNVWSTFYQHVFDSERNFEREHGMLKFDPEYDGENTVKYPSIVRVGSQIPLTYLWVGLGKITDTNKEMFTIDSDGPPYNHIDTFYYRGADGVDKIQAEDVEALVEYFAAATRSIERGISWKDASMMNDKERITGNTMDIFGVESTFTKAAQDMLDLEYESNVEEALSRYRNRPWQRAVQGEAIMFEVTETTELDGRTLVVRGDLVYDDVEAISNPEKPKNNCRLKDTSGSGSGSWIVGNKLNSEYTEMEIEDTPIDPESPEGVISGIQGSVVDYSPHTDGHDVKIHYRNSFAEKSRYESSHRWWKKTGRNLNTQKYTSVSRGDVFIVDKQADDITSARASKAIGPNHPIDDVINPLIDGGDVSDVEIGDEQAVTDYLNHLDEISDVSPNDKQRAFITDTTSQISVLQGPPGTGKTGGTLAPTLVSRSIAYHKNDENAIMAVTGTSNKSIDEVFESISERLEEVRETDLGFGNEFSIATQNTYPIRIVGDVPDPDDRLPHVGYYSYIHEKFVTGDEFPNGGVQMKHLLREAVREQFDDGRSHRPASSPYQFIIHTTPSRMMGLVNSFISREFDEDDSITYHLDEYPIFDTIAVDEASMFRIPEFFIPTAFMKDDAQLLIAGDHRQMPPVLQHDWDTEIRRSVNEYLPYASVLDYLRLLRGEDISYIDDDESVIVGDADVPFYRLNTTYRCHQTVADFLKDSIYTQDGIDYQSSQTKTFEPPTKQTGVMESLLNPQYPITLVVHDDETSGQVNVYESAIIQRVIESIGNTEAGVVTPHNAQRGLIQGNINAYAETADHDVNTQVDTVERFQGGEKELIVVGSTVSDPSTLANEDEFILSPNRINVAMSRMKTGLVVVVSKSLLDLIPNDIDTYERSYIWKSLWKHASKNEIWSGSMNDISPNTGHSNPNVSIYGIENIDV